MKITIRTLLLISTIVISLNAFGQQKKSILAKFTGSIYVINSDEYISLKYTRNYTISGSNFVTTYQIYSPTNGRLYQIITATHIVSESKIVVDIKDANGGIFAHINKEQTTYDTPTLEAFGFRGSAGMLSDRVPNQLMVKFKNNKFDYINVLNVNATEPGTDAYKAYILDKN